MATYSELAEQLTASLNLSLPPIAVAFSDAAPAGVAAFDGTVPAGCSFWQEAATRTFATSAADHALCSIGIHTHHLTPAPATHGGELQEALKAMSGLDYVRDDEVAAIPTLQREARHAVYGPLADFPLTAELVLLFAHAQQGADSQRGGGAGLTRAFRRRWDAPPVPWYPRSSTRVVRR